MPLDDSYSKALLHFDGADASTTFTDESGKTWTARGNAQIDTAQKVFGTASGLFDGTGDSVDTPDSADFYVGSGDGTIDFRIRFNSLPSSTGDSMCLCGQYKDSDNYIEIYLYKNAAANSYSLGFLEEVSGLGKWDIVKTVTLLTNTWYHMAFVKSGTNFHVFLDGVQQGTTGSDADEWADIAAVFNIGAIATATYAFNGWIDEFRFSNGVARWTADFTPSAVAYGAGGNVIIWTCE